MYKKKSFLVLSIVCSVILLAGCSTKKDPSVLRIGVVLPLTGSANKQGRSERSGVELAAKEINEAGGVLGKPLEIIFRDDETNVSRAANVLSTMIEADDVDAVIGGTSEAFIDVLAPIVNEERMVLLTPSAIPDTLKVQSEYVFEIQAPIARNQEIFERYLSNYKSSQRIAILSANTPSGIAYTDTFKKALANTDHELVREVVLPVADGNDIGQTITDLKAENVTVVLSALGADDSLQLLQQTRELDFHFNLLANDVLYAMYKRGEVDSVQMKGVAIYLVSAPSLAFQNRYNVFYQTQPGTYADTAYDAVYLLARAATFAQSTDPEALKNALHHIDSYLGASGLLDFSKTNYTENKQPLLKMFDGVNFREFVVGDVL